MKTLLIVLLLVPILALAETPQIPTILTVDGVEYRECEYRRHDQAYLHISHSDGLARLEISKLPDDVKTVLGFDAEKAGERKTEEQKKTAALAQALADQERQKANAKVLEEKITKEGREFNIEVMQVLPGGVLADYYIASGHSGGSAMSRIGGASAEGGYTTYSLAGKNFFFAGVKGMAEGQKKSLLAIPDGVYKYTDIGGSLRTVEKWRYVRDKK